MLWKKKYPSSYKSSFSNVCVRDKRFLDQSASCALFVFCFWFCFQVFLVLDMVTFLIIKYSYCFTFPALLCSMCLWFNLSFCVRCAFILLHPILFGQLQSLVSCSQFDFLSSWISFSSISLPLCFPYPLLLCLFSVCFSSLSLCTLFQAVLWRQPSAVAPWFCGLCFWLPLGVKKANHLINHLDPRNIQTWQSILLTT